MGNEFWGGDTYPKYKGLESIFLYREKAVSYTHLDVYKRQLLKEV